MNWTAISIASTAAVHAIIAIWYYGRLTERIDNQGTWLRDIDKMVNDHETRLSRLEGKQRGHS